MAQDKANAVEPDLSEPVEPAKPPEAPPVGPSEAPLSTPNEAPPGAPPEAPPSAPVELPAPPANKRPANKRPANKGPANKGPANKGPANKGDVAAGDYVVISVSDPRAGKAPDSKPFALDALRAKIRDLIESWSMIQFKMIGPRVMLLSSDWERFSGRVAFAARRDAEPPVGRA